MVLPRREKRWLRMRDGVKENIQGIIEKLTREGRSVFSEKVYLLAAELGIGELLVQDCLKQLCEEKFICEPMRGVLKRQI